MLVKICICGVDSTLNLKSKIIFVNNDLSIGDFLKMTKQDDGSKPDYTLWIINELRDEHSHFRVCSWF